jgi:hypothetical protein
VLPHQYTSCRGSSIGRACGSYNSKEINLKVVGSSPTFGYSYIKAHVSSCSFAFVFSTSTMQSSRGSLSMVQSIIVLYRRHLLPAVWHHESYPSWAAMYVCLLLCSRQVWTDGMNTTVISRRKETCQTYSSYERIRRIDRKRAL